MTKWFTLCGFLILALCVLFGCAANPKMESAVSPQPATPAIQVEEKAEATELALPSLTPFPDDSDMRALLDELPDYWGDWIPDDEPVYIVGVKEGFCRVTYDIHKSPAEMKQYYEQRFTDSEWGDGEWNSYDYTLSKHNPRMKLNISISGSPQKKESRVDVFQEYREEDGY